MSKKSSKKANKSNEALVQAVATEATEQAVNSLVGDHPYEEPIFSADDEAYFDSMFAADDAPAVTEAEMEAIEARIEGEGATPFVLEPTEAPAETKEEVVSAVQAPVQIITAPGEMGDRMQEVDEISTLAMIANIAGEITEREAFESAKSSDNTNIHKTIKKIRGSLARSHAAKLMLVANVSPGFINRVLQDGSKYNVYAILKVADLVDGLTGAGLTNAINIACMRSLFNFHKAGIAFTGEMAKAAASDKIRVSEAVKKHLVRHTVSASTAPTQASSTMQALQTLGVVKIEGSRKHPTYVVIDSPATRRLKEIADGYTGSVVEEAEAA